ncbi:MAG: hypothetical protein ACYCXW_01305 [Solirubrobacteraceae bacterium]
MIATSTFVGLSLSSSVGAFGAPAPETVSNSYKSPAAGDLYSSGRLELVGTSYTDKLVSAFVNNGDGTLGREQDIS